MLSRPVMPHAVPNHECIADCGACAAICAECASHCLKMGGAHASLGHQNAMRDCAEICALAACFMARGSAHAEHVCAECAEICKICADSCEKLGPDDQVMQRCALICRKCAQTCEAMTAAATRH